MINPAPGGTDVPLVRGPRRFDQIATDWSQVRKAVAPDHPERRDALDWFFQTYQTPMRALLSHILRQRDQTAIDDLVQEIYQQLAQGGFERASPAAGGRFRNYLKTATRRKAHEYLARQARRQEVFGADGILAQCAESTDDAPDRTFDRAEAAQIIDEALCLLAKAGGANGSRWHALVVKLRFWPEQFQVAPSADGRLRHRDLAARMTELTGETWSVDRFKKQLERSVQLCGQCIRQAVAARLRRATPEEIDEYIAELKLQRWGA